MMHLSTSQSDLSDELQEISAFDRVACVEHWTVTFGTVAPKYLSINFMQRVLAREQQLRGLGGLNRPGFVGDQLVRVTRPYRVCSGLHRRPPLPQPVVYFRWVQAGGGC